MNTPPLQEIRFVSRLLQNRYRKKESKSFDHQLLYKSNFWEYCDKIFEPAENRVKPNFSEKDCYKYFKKTLSEKNRFGDYNTPLWMQKLNKPTIDFNLEAPTYREITKTIFKMKSSSSPSQLDQVSIIALKKCPFLRTYLLRIISASWNRGDFPTVWKRGITVLAYKKGSNEDSANFRPITLQPILSKVFISILRNRIYDFCYKNKIIESNLQKGFWDNISGCVEHTETLTHTINQARKKQRSLIITLLDLKNAFGEVSHELPISVLTYHHLPDHIVKLVTSLYTDYQVTVATDNFVTSPIIVHRGVLQGDSLCPLLFNLVINTLIATIKQDKRNCMGYVYDYALAPKHWMQFTDDAALVAALESDNSIYVTRLSSGQHRQV